ncbi:hypothetical protein NSK11_contig00124-0011 [Nocardia seriolae]|uniref:Uncharacterized protein n=1 Tax=Nocardia seriolae TaxID=37332 RepID=A0ABC9Z1W5_9NOCA|nr:hypothetical protein NSERKGN1266_17360 [Nocardia seriolae]BEK98391.1 hypothetical protein NSER024013_62970 [Nocardia seriolae]GAM49695.1 hypothetical protein NS07_v2contig00119-0012 [Nocardia seriolae]GAP31709.1 hypothetical protein NSK11_contig00124-0011 [Nocardia seriolae]GEM27352.1 hypothetical protein NS2_55910 [Nocardia seriolae NBRC 15557]
MRSGRHHALGSPLAVDAEDWDESVSSEVWGVSAIPIWQTDRVAREIGPRAIGSMLERKAASGACAAAPLQVFS